MVKKLIYTLSLLTLTACGQPQHWAKLGEGMAINDGILAEDNSFCRFEAAKATAAMTDAFKQGAQSQGLYNECLVSRGYYLRAD